MTIDQNGWQEWSKFVLKELERLNVCYDNISQDIAKVRVEIATLKVKSGVWGAVGAMIPISITLVLMYLKASVG